MISPLGVRVKELLGTGIQFEFIDKSSSSPVPTWLLKLPELIYVLHDIGINSAILSDVFKSKLNQILADFDG